MIYWKMFKYNIMIRIQHWTQFALSPSLWLEFRFQFSSKTLPYFDYSFATKIIYFNIYSIYIYFISCIVFHYIHTNFINEFRIPISSNSKFRFLQIPNSDLLKFVNSDSFRTTNGTSIYSNPPNSNASPFLWVQNIYFSFSSIHSMCPHSIFISFQLTSYIILRQLLCIRYHVTFHFIPSAVINHSEHSQTQKI